MRHADSVVDIKVAGISDDFGALDQYDDAGLAGIFSRLTAVDLLSSLNVVNQDTGVILTGEDDRN